MFKYGDCTFVWVRYAFVGNECPPHLECGTQDYPNKTVTVELIVN